MPKPDRTLNLYSEYRKVNQLTRADSFSLPRTDAIIDSVGNAAYVTK